MSDDARKTPPALDPNDPPEGIFVMAGTFVGQIRSLDEVIDQRPPEPDDEEKKPAGFLGLRRLRRRLNAEARENPLTLFEVYVVLYGAVYGLFLLLPFSTFDATGSLWDPIRLLFNERADTFWYASGAEFTVGASLVAVHGLHGATILRRRAGDVLRRRTICALFGTWLTLSLVFYFGEPWVQSFAFAALNFVVLFLALRKLFGLAGER